MTLRTRNLLFYAVTTLFFAMAVSAIFYSNGWRFDLETFSINKLGGIYFEDIPDGATLTVEKADVEFNPSFLRSSLLVPNLFPKKYIARINRPDYQPWTKEIPVLPSLVTEIQPVILLPEKSVLENPLSQNVSDFWEKSGQVITASKSGELFYGNSRISGSSVIAWSDDADAVLTESGTNNYLVRLDNPKSALNLSLMFSNARRAAAIKDRAPIRQISFRTGESDSVIIRTEDGLYLLDAARSTLNVISPEPIHAYGQNESEILFAGKTGVFSHSSGITSTITPILPIIQPSEIRFNDSGTYFTMQNASGDLILADRNKLEAKILAKNARTAFFAAGHLKLAFTTFNNELVIYTFGKKYQILDNPKTEILRLSIADQESLTWHADAAHIFMQYPDSAYLLEADEIPPINLQTIDTGVDKFQYDAENEKLYLLKKSALYRISI